MLNAIIKILSKLIEMLISSRQEPTRKSSDSVGLLWYPNAKIEDFKTPTQGQYKDKYPIGAVVHYTAGRFKNDIEDAINTGKYMAAQKYGSFIISRSGRIIQSFPLDQWAYHAGESFEPTLGKSLSSKLVGIEVCCAGKLEKKNDKYFSWYGEEIPEQDVRKGGISPGCYHKYSKEQEDALKELIFWLKKNNPEIFNFNYVFAHEEIAFPRGRKQDPGASLSCNMDVFRKMLNVEHLS